MELIFEIIAKLKRYERREIKNLFKHAPFSYDKVGLLFDLVLKHPNKEENFYAQKLYGKDADNTFRVTKSRLKRILEDEILNDKSMTAYSADYINKYLQSKKRLLQGEILLGRGAWKSSRNLLLQSQSKAAKYALHDIELDSLLLLSRNQSINLSATEFDKNTEELLKLNKINYLVNKAAISHYSIKNLLSTRTIDDKEELLSIANKIEQMEAIAQETESPKANYYFLLTKVIYLQYIGDFHEAKEFCRQYIHLIETEVAVSSEQRRASANFQMAEIALRTAHYDEAKHYVDKTLGFLQEQQLNYLIVLSTAYRIAFKNRQFNECHSILETAYKHPRFEASPMRKAQWAYNKCALAFTEGDLKLANITLNDATELLNDKYGWNITFRLLEIMILFESGYTDLLDSRILNLKQFIKRAKPGSELYRPMQLINILMKLHKYSLSVKRSAKTIKPLIESLMKDEKLKGSEGTELIRLEDWLYEKL